MKTTTERAAEIRAAYKRKGWSSRKVSVRTDYFSMGSSIHVEIKSPEVDETEASRIAHEAERIRRDGCGEILSGGNRYVSVTHSRECREIMARRHIDELTKALERLEASGSRTQLEPIRGAGEALVGMDGWHARLWIDGRAQMQFNPRDEGGRTAGAFHLALLLDREASAERLAQPVPEML